MKDHYSELKIVHFSRNFGQQQALLAGIKAANGEVLATLDVDLQQPPALIPSMVRLYEKGYQVVHAIPEYHQSATWFKKLTSKAYYKFIQALGPDQVVYKSNDFRLFSHPVAEVVRSLPEQSLYLRGIFAWLCPLNQRLKDDEYNDPDTWAATTLKYRHQSRQHGQTKYSIPRMVALAFDGMTAISIQPLRFGLFLGMGSIALAMALIIWALYMHLIVGQTVSGWTSIMIVILFFSSIQFLLMGLMGEYLGKVFLQVRGRPGYITSDGMKHGNETKLAPKAGAKKPRPNNRSPGSNTRKKEGRDPLEIYDDIDDKGWANLVDVVDQASYLDFSYRYEDHLRKCFYNKANARQYVFDTLSVGGINLHRGSLKGSTPEWFWGEINANELLKDNPDHPKVQALGIDENSNPVIFKIKPLE
ncbi:glycosyltransferase [Membranicola marinus]|uniref:Glycosyltransferase n=1 Tax=Membranihabitans marinus TaxID=1227546 RepID=A0A953HWK6_9BACT|nr:glycosyltransferase [Membranihabitans marinus]